MSQKTLNLCLERYNFVKFGETTKSSHTVLCINNAYSVNSDKYRLTPTVIASKHGEGYVFTLNYDFDRPLFTIVQKSYALDGTSGDIVFEGIDPISKGGSKYLRKVTVSPVKLSDGSYLLEVTKDEYLRIGTTGAALGDEELESLNEKIVATGGIEKSVETVEGKQVLKLDASGSAGAKEIVYFDVGQSDIQTGLYDAIGEALSNNKLPAIRSDGKLYMYTSTGTYRYDFVGVFSTDNAGYKVLTIFGNDAIVKETVDTIEGMVFPLYYYSNDEGFTVADKTGHALTKTEIADAYRAGQIFMFSSYPAYNTQAHWGYCCDINIDSDNTGYAEFFILAAFGGDSYEWEKYRINLSSGTEFVTLWGPNTSYSTGYSGSYADGATTVSVSTTQNFNSTQKAKGRDNIGAVGEAPDDAFYVNRGGKWVKAYSLQQIPVEGFPVDDSEAYQKIGDFTGNLYPYFKIEVTGEVEVGMFNYDTKQYDAEFELSDETHYAQIDAGGNYEIHAKGTGIVTVVVQADEFETEGSGNEEA